MRYILAAVMLIMLVPIAFAASTVVRLDVNGVALVSDQIDSCNQASYFEDSNLTTYDMQIAGNCTVANTEIQYSDEINLVLGDILPGEVQSGENWVYVDSLARPDLDLPATLVFNHHGFAVKPVALRNGFPCEGIQCNVTSFTPEQLTMDVNGFSNYSLTFAQDFTVYSDPEPELKDKTYQTIDLGDSHRADNYTCTVQVFGRNQNADWILVQTNPARNVQARMFGSPDQNQPESLGYFPVVNGMANTYFRGGELPGYNDFELVIQCANPTNKLVYEEPISTRYSPAGRTITARGVWLTDGSNAAYIAFYFFGGLIVLWIVVMIFRRTFRRY